MSGGEAAALTHAELEEQLGSGAGSCCGGCIRITWTCGRRASSAVRGDRGGRHHPQPGGGWSPAAAGDGVRPGHGDPDGLPGAGAANLHPADAALNLPEERHSHVAPASGDRGRARLVRVRRHGHCPRHRVVVGKRQVEELALRAAADLDAFCAGRCPGPRPDDELLY